MAEKQKRAHINEERRRKEGKGVIDTCVPADE